MRYLVALKEELKLLSEQQLSTSVFDGSLKSDSYDNNDWDFLGVKLVKAVCLDHPEVTLTYSFWLLCTVLQVLTDLH